jgi:hypothetical protein
MLFFCHLLAFFLKKPRVAIMFCDSFFIVRVISYFGAAAVVVVDVVMIIYYYQSFLVSFLFLLYQVGLTVFPRLESILPWE